MSAVLSPAAPDRARVLALFVFAIVVVLAGTVLIPFLFPATQSQSGISTAVGSNNQTVYAWYVAAILVSGILFARLLPVPADGRTPDIATAWRAVDRRWLAVTIAAHVLLFGALFAYKGRFVFSEGIYFQGLLNRMSLGEVPYVDFSYWYGPSMLYPAHWLGAVVGLEAGYAIWHVVTYSVGIVFLFLAVAGFLGGGKRAAWLSAALSVALFNPMTGLNFTLARYLMPTIVFLVAQDPILRGGRRGWALAAVALSIAGLYSFETAVLSAAAVLFLTTVAAAGLPIQRALAWAGARIGTGPGGAVPTEGNAFGPSEARAFVRGVSLLLVAAVVDATAFLAIDPAFRALMAYPEAARSDLAGAHNTPVYPEVPFIAMSAATLFAIAGVIRVLTRAPARRDQLTLGAFLAMALVAQRPSFSVSDPQHHLFFGLAALLLCLHLTTRFPTARRASSLLLAVAFAGLAASVQIYQVYALLPFFRSGATAAVPAAASSISVRKSSSVQATLTDIAQRVGTDRYYLMYALDYYSVPVHHRLGLRYASYDTDLNSVTTTDIVERLIGELKDRNAVVIIDRTELDTGKRAFQADALGNAIAWVTSAPMPGSDLQSVIFENDSRIQASLLRFLREGCRPLLELDGFVALEPIR